MYRKTRGQNEIERRNSEKTKTWQEAEESLTVHLRGDRCGTRQARVEVTQDELEYEIDFNMENTGAE